MLTGRPNSYRKRTAKSSKTLSKEPRAGSGPCASRDKTISETSRDLSVSADSQLDGTVSNKTTINQRKSRKFPEKRIFGPELGRDRITLRDMSNITQMMMMTVAAVFEVGGNALIRRGITGGGIALVAMGFIVLGTYGVVINLIGLDFSRLLGAYVGWFAVVSVLFGRIFFGDRITVSLWVGLALILVGSLVIQTGLRGPLPSVSRSVTKNVP